VAINDASFTSDPTAVTIAHANRDRLRLRLRTLTGALIALLVSLGLVLYLYPYALPYIANLGDCSGACVERAQSNARLLGSAVLAPFALAGLLLSWGGRSQQLRRKGGWLILMGAYLSFFPVVHWLSV